MGTMIEGRVEAGAITKDSKLIMMPNREEIGVSALYGETEVKAEKECSHCEYDFDFATRRNQPWTINGVGQNHPYKKKYNISFAVNQTKCQRHHGN
jgi:hypothetical protein